MSCSNCYNGCTEITSDKCVKYTGVDVPALGIKNGDSLSYVEQSLIGFITSMLNGEGIVLDISPNVICLIVSKYLPECGELTLPNMINALLRGLCETYQVAAGAAARIGALDEAYDLQCVTGVTATAGIRNILQATITKLCSVNTSLSALSTNVNVNYVKIADINSYIATYLASLGTSTKYYNRMVPYTVVEYYGSLSGNFDATGAGLGDWEKIYLCNGNNGTPDKRGRVGVGATTGMGGGAMNAAVDPAIAGNPSYALLGTAGSNTVTLSTAEIPSHTHTVNTPTVTDPGHTHFTVSAGNQQSPLTSAKPIAAGAVFGGNTSYELAGIVETTEANIGLTNKAYTGISISVSMQSAGGGGAHNNYQPGLGCYYIMYIP